MIKRTMTDYRTVAPNFKKIPKVDWRLRDPKRLRHLASQFRVAANQEEKWAQTALNEALSEKGRSQRVAAVNHILAEELLWDSKIALKWYRGRVARAAKLRSTADKLIRRAQKIKLNLQR